MTNNELLLAISEMMDTRLKSELQPLKNDLQSVRDELQSVRDDLQYVRDDLQSVRDEVHQIKLQQENVVLPRLGTIESCYTDTYNRYKNYTEKMETVFDDVELMKKVIAEHSEQLHKLA